MDVFNGCWIWTLEFNHRQSLPLLLPRNLLFLQGRQRRRELVAQKTLKVFKALVFSSGAEILRLLLFVHESEECWNVKILVIFALIENNSRNAATPVYSVNTVWNTRSWGSFVLFLHVLMPLDGKLRCCNLEDAKLHFVCETSHPGDALISIFFLSPTVRSCHASTKCSCQMS